MPCRERSKRVMFVGVRERVYTVWAVRGMVYTWVYTRTHVSSPGFHCVGTCMYFSVTVSGYIRCKCISIRDGETPNKHLRRLRVAAAAAPVSRRADRQPRQKGRDSPQSRSLEPAWEQFGATADEHDRREKTQLSVSRE